MLFIDPAVGRESFFDAARQVVTDMFGQTGLSAMEAGSPLLTGKFAGGVGIDLGKVGYSEAVAARQADLDRPVLLCVKIDGRIAVVLSRYGVTCPVEGHPTYGCEGLTVPDARRLAANVVLYAAARSGNAAKSR